MKSSNLAIIVAVVAVLGIGGVAIYALNNNDSMDMSSMNESSMSNDSSGDAADAKETDMVEIKNFAFSPQVIKVKAGTKVTWTNQDTVKHNAVKDDGQSDGPDGPLLAKGESYSYTFKKAGTYTYHCDPHRSMTATVIVE